MKVSNAQICIPVTLFSVSLGTFFSVMEAENRSIVTLTEFVLTGFPGLHPQYQDLVSAALFLLYLLTLINNGTVLYLFATDRSLHKPMYYIIVNLSVCDVVFSSATLPKIITKYWFQAESISFTACFVQMYFVHYLGTANSFILFMMALDRYLAICHPLRYTLVLTNSNICILSVTAWLVPNAIALMLVIRAYPLPYCASNVIRHCFCDHISITTLACTDRTSYGLSGFGAAVVVHLCPMTFIIFSYCCIINAVLKIANLQGRLKTLSTCIPQLVIISFYYIPRCFIYFSTNFGITFSTDIRVVIIMAYSLLPPVINPMIYSLRAKDMRDSLWKRFNRRTNPQKTFILAISN